MDNSLAYDYTGSLYFQNGCYEVSDPADSLNWGSLSFGPSDISVGAHMISIKVMDSLGQYSALETIGLDVQAPSPLVGDMYFDEYAAWVEFSQDIDTTGLNANPSYVTWHVDGRSCIDSDFTSQSTASRCSFNADEISSGYHSASFVLVLDDGSSFTSQGTFYVKPFKSYFWRDSTVASTVDFGKTYRGSGYAWLSETANPVVKMRTKVKSQKWSSWSTVTKKSGWFDLKIKVLGDTTVQLQMQNKSGKAIAKSTFSLRANASFSVKSPKLMYAYGKKYTFTAKADKQYLAHCDVKGIITNTDIYSGSITRVAIDEAFTLKNGKGKFVLSSKLYGTFTATVLCSSPTTASTVQTISGTFYLSPND